MKMTSDNIIFALDIILGAILLAIIFTKLYLRYLGKEEVVVTPASEFTLLEKDEKEVVLQKEISFKNVGKSCATIMDAISRPQLPFEQYDKVEAWGIAERKGAPREDDYFESVLIQKKGDNPDEITLLANIILIGRKGLSINEALKEMPDISIDFIWLETGRTPCNYKKIILRLSGDEIRKLANV